MSDYVSEAVKKATKIHARLPPGGILIFLTGQNEISGVSRKLEAKFGQKAIEAKRRRRKGANGHRSDAKDANVNDAHIVATVTPAQGLSIIRVFRGSTLPKSVFNAADVEVEEMELGELDQDDLAFDVDGPAGEFDADALDSEDDESADNAALGIDTEESDGASI